MGEKAKLLQGAVCDVLKWLTLPVLTSMQHTAPDSDDAPNTPRRTLLYAMHFTRLCHNKSFNILTMRSLNKPRAKWLLRTISLREYDIYIYIIQFKAVLFHATKHDPKRPKYKGPSNIDYKERRSRARGAYPTQ